MPVGVNLILGETAEGYTTTAISANGAQDEDSAEKSFTLTVAGDDVITFTNSAGGTQVVLKKAGVTNTDQNQTQIALGGAVFTLFEAEGDHLDRKGRVVTVDGEPLRNMTSDDLTGVFWSGTLPSGTYILEEERTPAGYNRLGVLIRMEVGGEGVVLSYIGTTGNPAGIYNTPVMENNTWTVTVINTAGVTLPSTGGAWKRSDLPGRHPAHGPCWRISGVGKAWKIQERSGVSRAAKADGRTDGRRAGDIPFTGRRGADAERCGASRRELSLSK